jgi:hypothetical protein
MRKNIVPVIICIFVVAVMILPSFQAATSEIEVSNCEKRVYTGPNEIYREVEKGKPPGTPGGGKPPKDNGPEPDPSVNKWAVVIGISDYRGKMNDLQYCDDDARDMYDYLILSMNYPEGNIKLLLDGAAKAKSIISAIDWLNSWENLESEVVFFYSGHGSYYDGYDDGDLEDRDEGIVSADLYLILDGQLRQKFSSFESQKISFTFDCCYSGGMDDLAGSEESGRVVVAACEDDEYSYDGMSDISNGVFTYHFLQELNDLDVIESAFDNAKLPASTYISDNYGATMTPQIYDEYLGDWSFI